MADESSPLTGSVSRTSMRFLQHGQYGTLGSMSIAVNFLTGPAMLQIPSLYKKSGWIPTTMCILCTGFFATLACLHFANAISKIQGNRTFSKEIEYSNAFQLYWPNNSWISLATEISFFLCVTCLNVSSLVDSAQVFDVMLCILGGTSHALSITPSSSSSSSSSSETTTMVGGLDFAYQSWDFSSCDDNEDCIPFSNNENDSGVLLTLGYIVNVIIFMPLALMNLQVIAVSLRTIPIFALLLIQLATTNSICMIGFLLILRSLNFFVMHLILYRTMLHGRSLSFLF